MTCDRSVVFSGTSINKTDRHDITEILLKVALKAHSSNLKSRCLLFDSNASLAFYGVRFKPETKMF